MKGVRNIIFLDIDGVLNSELFYRATHASRQLARKKLRKEVKKKSISEQEYNEQSISRDGVQLLNDLCAETKSAIVVSSSWRLGRTVEQLQAIFNQLGGTFKVLDKTGHCECSNRGCEIRAWLKDNTDKYFKKPYYDFYRYAIIDDDSDMLLEQAAHFFHVDRHAGLTPNTCYRIKRFFTHETF